MLGIGKATIAGQSKFEFFVRNAYTIQPVKSDLDIYLKEGAYICSEGSDSHFELLCTVKDGR